MSAQALAETSVARRDEQDSPSLTLGLNAALYQLMRQRHLTIKDHKNAADRLFKKHCIEDGVPPATAHIYYLGLKLGGKPSTDPKNERKIQTATA